MLENVSGIRLEPAWNCRLGFAKWLKPKVQGRALYGLELWPGTGSNFGQSRDNDCEACFQIPRLQTFHKCQIRVLEMIPSALVETT
jgi:hypothetical protein